MNDPFYEEKEALLASWQAFTKRILAIPEQPLSSAPKGAYVMVSGQGSLLWIVNGPATVLRYIPKGPPDNKRVAMGKQAMVRVINADDIAESNRLFSANDELYERIRR